MKQLSLNAPHMVIMVGIPGSGKSAFAERFASTFDAPLISSQKMHASFKGSGMHKDDIEQIVNLMQIHTLTELLKTRQTIIYDGESHSRVKRKALIDFISKSGYEPMIVWVQTDTNTAKERVLKPIRSKSGRQDATEVFEGRLKAFTPPNDSEKYIVISGKHTYPSQLKVVLKKLAEARAELAAVASKAANSSRTQTNKR